MNSTSDLPAKAALFTRVSNPCQIYMKAMFN